MIISFQAIPTKTGKLIISNIKEDKKDLMDFPIKGVDVKSLEKGYKIYFDVYTELDNSHVLTDTLNEVKRIFLRKYKIDKINDTIRNT